MRPKSGGWAGGVLRVNLSDQSSRVNPSEPYTGRFVGGLGLAAKIAWDEISPRCSALGAENKLIFAAGPLTGTLAPGSGRLEVVAKSPRTYPQETVTRSGLGGHWGRELKLAGYDALVLEGRAERPVYLLVQRNGVEFHPAEDLWGQDTFATQKLLRRRHGSRSQAVCIGPAGENQALAATIMSETSFCAGKSGFGAVMGAKKVKAIVVDGSGGSIGVAHPGRLIQLQAHYRELLGVSPMREWTVGYVPPAHHLEFFNKYRSGNASCFGCPLQCMAFVRVPGLEPSQISCVNWFYLNPAHDYYGPGLEADQAFWSANLLSNKLGLDTFELAGVAPWLKDLHEAGLIDEKSAGLPLSRFGSREYISQLIEAIAFRRGLGDVLALGAARAAERLPGAWSIYERYYPAHGQTEHDSVRNFPGIALLWALDSRDPMIDHHAYRHLSVTRLRWPKPHGLTREQAEAAAENIFGDKTAIDHSTYQAKARAVAYCQNRSRVMNALVLCDLLYPIFISQSRSDRLGDTAAESRLFSAVTGRETSEPELDLIGERIFTLERAIMVREGRTRADDTLHQGHFEDLAQDSPAARAGGTGYGLAADESRAVPRADFERAKTEYYNIRGYDPETGVPTRRTLLDLGLGEVAAELWPQGSAGPAARPAGERGGP